MNKDQYEPYWDDSMRIHTGSMNEEQSNESYASYDTDSATKEEEQKLKATVRQPMIKASKQLTLQPSSRSTRKDSLAMHGGFGIFVHRTSHLGSRTLQGCSLLK